MRLFQEKGSQLFELWAHIKTFAKLLRICLAAYESSTSWMSILSLQSEFLLTDWARRFSIAWSARRTTLIFETGVNESLEKWMRSIRFALEFRVILATNEIRVITKLDQLGQRSVRCRSGNDETFFIHTGAIFHVELVSVTVALLHFSTAVNFFRERAFANFRRPCAQAHAGAHTLDAALFFQQRDHRFFGVLVELSA